MLCVTVKLNNKKKKTFPSSLRHTVGHSTFVLKLLKKALNNNNNFIDIHLHLRGYMKERHKEEYAQYGTFFMV